MSVNLVCFTLLVVKCGSVLLIRFQLIDQTIIVTRRVIKGYSRWKLTEYGWQFPGEKPFSFQLVQFCCQLEWFLRAILNSDTYLPQLILDNIDRSMDSNNIADSGMFVKSHYGEIKRCLTLSVQETNRANWHSHCYRFSFKTCPGVNSM